MGAVGKSHGRYYRSLRARPPGHQTNVITRAAGGGHFNRSWTSAVTRPVDVLVVGAGPAGSAAAIVLARAGVTVRLIDRAQFPRDKLCGDTLNPGCLSILTRLALADRVQERALPVTGMTVTGPGGAVVSADYPDALQGAALTRRDLDVMLISAAADAGACVETGVVVRAPLIGENGRLLGVRVARGPAEYDLFARIVIAADGRHSTLAFRLGLARFAPAPKRWAFGAYFTDVDAMTTRGEMHIRPDEYIGLAPLPGGITNVCVVRELHTNVRAQRTRMEDAIVGAVTRDPQLRDRFEEARQVSEVTSLGPLAVDVTTAGGDGLLLAGDAAGFIDPMTGDGLRFALRGGELAAEAAQRELASNEPAYRSLAEARQREFGSKWRLNRALRWLAGSPDAVRLSAAVATRWRAPVARLIGMAGDCALARETESLP
jgi:menaquinone-9 beta-reductase